MNPPSFKKGDFVAHNYYGLHGVVERVSRRKVYVRWATGNVSGHPFCEVRLIRDDLLEFESKTPFLIDDIFRADSALKDEMGSPHTRKRLITAYLEDSCIKVVEDCGPTVMDARAIVLTFKEASDLCRVIQELLDRRARDDG